MTGKTKKLMRSIKKQIPHTISDMLQAVYPVPERHPPSFVLDKIGSKRVSFAGRSINIPKYKMMHGSEYLKKHKDRLQRDWGH